MSGFSYIICKYENDKMFLCFSNRKCISITILIVVKIDITIMVTIMDELLYENNNSFTQTKVHLINIRTLLAISSGFI